MKLAILTATYNHPINLCELYKTLKNQEDKNFTWIIVDDGSNDETGEEVKKILAENTINVYYERKENGGKSSAINRGLDLCEDSDFVLIIDDDELLYPHAVTMVKEYYNKYKDTECGIINFARAHRDGTPILKMDEEGDFYATVQEFKKKGFQFDGYVGYYTNKLEGKRFPLFTGEKYIGPSVLIMLVSKKYTNLWTHTVLGTTEYLEGGITKMGRKLRIRNPKGMIFHAGLYMEACSGFYIRFAYSVRAYAYMYYAGLTKENLDKEGIDMCAFYPVSFLGRMLAYKWKIQYSF